MPKQSFHINRFEGGLNTDLAPEDIPNNSLLDSLGVSVSKIGRIVMSGDPQSDASGASPNIDTIVRQSTPGYGLFAFNSDYDKNHEENATNYLALSNGSQITIFDESDWVAGFTFDLQSTPHGGDTGNDTEPSYYAPNGDLRVCDGKFNNANNYDNNAKWFGYIPNKTIGSIYDANGATASYIADAIIGGWKAYHSSIEGGYPKDANGYATNAFFVDEETSVNTTTEANFRGDYLNNVREWGLHIQVTPATTSGTDAKLADSTWQPDVTTEYKFYSSYVYDGIQEGNPTPLKMYPGFNSLDNVASTSTLQFFDGANTGAKTAHIDSLVRSSTNLTVTMSAAHEFVVDDVVYIETADGTYDGKYTITAVGTTTTSNDNFVVTVAASGSNITVSDSHSVAVVVGQNLALYMSFVVKINGAEQDENFCFGSNAITDATGGNERITGTRLYYSSSDEGHANLWIIFDCDFEKGVKAYGLGLVNPTVTDYVPMRSSGQSSKADLGSFNIFKHPPKYETYESLNGYSHDSKLDAKWKTAVIANGRTYIGNIKRRQKSTFNVIDTALTNGKQDWNGISADEIKKDPTFGDRILKSPVDRFDTFPEEMAIELFGGDDGDSIVKLETFADRLLVFKKNTLHILNIAKDVEILESSHTGMGLDGEKPCQSCLTSTGVAWINSNGVYHYNGQSIESLTDNKIESFWKGHKRSYLNSSYTKFFLSVTADVPSIGFDENSSKLIIHKVSTKDGSDEEDVLIYDMKIKAWHWLKETLSTHHRSNMVTYNKGTFGKYLIYHGILASGNATNSFYKYSDTPSASVASASASEGLNVITKPYDFGSPLTRKKIYKVYVTYRCNGATNVQLQYYVNGNYGSLYNFTTGASNPFNANDDNIDADISIMELDDTSGLWETSSLKPVTSSQANNIKSFGLKFFNDAGESVNAAFEINDITIIYRNKSVK